MNVTDDAVLQDHVLIQLGQTGLRGHEEHSVAEDDPILVVHPNYVIDAQTQVVAFCVMYDCD